MNAPARSGRGGVARRAARAEFSASVSEFLGSGRARTQRATYVVVDVDVVRRLLTRCADWTESDRNSWRRRRRNAGSNGGAPARASRGRP